MSALRKNVAGQHIGFVLTNSSTGAPVTAGGAGTVVIDGGAQAACAGTFTHKGTGQWDYAPTQGETNGTSICFAFTGTSALQVGMQLFTLNYDTTLAQVPANTTQLAGQTVTAGAGVTFPASVASPTNITAATGITVATNNDKTGYSLTQSFPTNFASLAITAGGAVTVGTNNDKTGYSLSQAFPTNFSALGISAGGAINTVTALTTNNDKTGYSLTAAEETAIADALLNRDMSIGTDNGSTTVRTPRQAFRQLRNKWTISGGTITVFKEDDTTTSWTGIMGTDAAALPIVSSDPAG